MRKLRFEDEYLHEYWWRSEPSGSSFTDRIRTIRRWTKGKIELIEPYVFSPSLKLKRRYCRVPNLSFRVYTRETDK